MNCTFFGHRNAPSSVKEKLKETILRLLGEGVEQFYVGNNGAFDCLVQVVLAELEKDRPIKYSIVLSYIDERAICENQEATVLVEGQEMACPRYRISKRNEWLLKNADIVVTYMINKYSNTYKLVEKSLKKGKTVINLAD